MILGNFGSIELAFGFVDAGLGHLSRLIED